MHFFSRSGSLKKGKPPVLPSLETVKNGMYQPLSRPIFTVLRSTRNRWTSRRLGNSSNFTSGKPLNWSKRSNMCLYRTRPTRWPWIISAKKLGTFVTIGVALVVVIPAGTIIAIYLSEFAIGMSRAIGETAPIITIGALTFIAFLPTSPLSGACPYLNFKWLLDPFTVMPIQMFNWTSRPEEAFQVNAAAAGVILLAMTLLINALKKIFTNATGSKRMITLPAALDNRAAEVGLWKKNIR